MPPKYLLPFLLFFFLPKLSISQNVFGNVEILQFANYLYKNELYEMAAEEYERAIFLSSPTPATKIKLLTSYRLSANFAKAIDCRKRFYKYGFYVMPDSAKIEFSKTLIQSKNSRKYLQLSDSLALKNRNLQNNLRLLAMLKSGKWKKISNFLSNSTHQSLIIISQKINHKKHKSTWLSASFAAIVPGSQGFYTKDYKNAAIMLLGVALNTWQAARGFATDGKNSAYGWFFASISFGFYGNGIFKAVQSAKYYNQRQNKKIYEQMQLIDIDTL